MLDDEEAIEHLEEHRRHGEEVEGHNHLTVILEKSQPALARIRAAPDPARMASDTSFRDHEAELQKLSMDLRGSPSRVLVRQSAHQAADFCGDLRASRVTARAPAP